MFKVIVFGRGFVVVAKTEDCTEITQYGHSWVRVAKYVTVRRWGTDKGLGQIVHEGPLDTTTLDPGEWPIAIPVVSIHQMMDVERDGAVSAWDEASRKCLLSLLG